MASYLISLILTAARSLDDISTHAVASGTSSTVVSLSLKNATSGASADAHDGDWMFLRTAGVPGQQRIVKPGSLIVGSGTLSPTQDWTTPPTTADILYLTHYMPCIGDGGADDCDYRACINRAAARLAYRDRISLAIKTGYSYSVAGYRWLDRRERLLRILEPGPDGGRAVDCAWRGWNLVLDGPTPVIEFDVPFENATGSLILDVMRPADSLISTAGTWAEGSGMANDTDQIRVEPEDIMPAIKMMVYEALMARSPGRPFPGADAQYQFWLGESRKLRLWDRTQDVEQAPQQAPGAAA